MAKETVLVVDDEDDILELVRFNLAKEGYNVVCTDTGERGLDAARDIKPDLIVLDLMLPGIDGLDVARRLKAEKPTASIPIIMLTAKGEEADIVSGLELGADDYITKPFSVRILQARVKAVIRRKREPQLPQDESLTVEDLVIHPGRREVRLAGKRLDLTYTEFQILTCLARQPGWVYTRGQIVDAVRGDDYPVTDRSVDVQIVGLRKKLKDCGHYIETVRGVGYRFKEPST